MHVVRIMQPPPERLALEEASTADLVREALDEARELVRLEVQIAKSEVQKEIALAKRAAMGFVAAVVLGQLLLATLVVVIVLALGGTALIALAVSGVLFVLTGAAAIVGYASMPKKPLEPIKNRLETGVRQLKEHIA
jgi:hypothetical protein